MAKNDEFFAKYAQTGYQQVEGWAQPHVFPIVKLISDYQRENNLGGDVAEIGVHHGKFFIGLHNCMAEKEISVAMDIFDDQRLNIAYSGAASMQRFLENLARHAFEPERCVRIAGDSLALRDSEIARALPRPVRTRLFSVDGGHMPEHTLNDLDIAVRMSHGHGVIFIDDYYNPHWPGVHIGVNKFFDRGYPSFVPFGYMRDKLMLTSVTWQKTYFDLLAMKFKDEPQFKVVQMFGYRVAVV